MASKFDPASLAKDLDDSLAKGEVKRALDEAANALDKLNKEGDPQPYFKALEKIAKTAVPNDKKKVKDDKDAQKTLDEIKKAAETERKESEKLLFAVQQEQIGKPA